MLDVVFFDTVMHCELLSMDVVADSESMRLSKAGTFNAIAGAYLYSPGFLICTHERTATLNALLCIHKRRALPRGLMIRDR